MEDGQIETFTSEIYKMKDAIKTADKNKAHRANKADKKKDAAKELQKIKDQNKKLTARLAQARIPFLEDKRGTEEEIDAEQVQLYTSNTTPRKQRFGPAEKQRAGEAFGRTLASGLRLGDRLGETRSEKELKINFINKTNNYSGNKRFRETREQPITEEDGDWHYVEEENCPGIDAQAAEVGYGAMDEDQDVYDHSV